MPVAYIARLPGYTPGQRQGGTHVELEGGRCQYIVAGVHFGRLGRGLPFIGVLPLWGLQCTSCKDALRLVNKGGIPAQDDGAGVSLVQRLGQRIHARHVGLDEGRVLR